MYAFRVVTEGRSAGHFCQWRRDNVKDSVDLETAEVPEQVDRLHAPGLVPLPKARPTESTLVDHALRQAAERRLLAPELRAREWLEESVGAL